MIYVTRRSTSHLDNHDTTQTHRHRHTDTDTDTDTDTHTHTHTHTRARARALAPLFSVNLWPSPANALRSSSNQNEYGRSMGGNHVAVLEWGDKPCKAVTFDLSYGCCMQRFRGRDREGREEGGRMGVVVCQSKPRMLPQKHHQRKGSERQLCNSLSRQTLDVQL